MFYVGFLSSLDQVRLTLGDCRIIQLFTTNLSSQPSTGYTCLFQIFFLVGSHYSRLVRTADPIGALVGREGFEPYTVWFLKPLSLPIGLPSRIGFLCPSDNHKRIRVVSTRIGLMALCLYLPPNGF